MAAGLLLMTTAQANDVFQEDPMNDGYKDYKKVQPVLFTYDLVEYAIYPDGHLEYELPRRVQPDHYSRRSSQNRRGIYASNQVNHNQYGQLTYINGTRIAYNRNGQVARLGNLNVNYYHGILDQVGGLEVRYNKKGKLIAARGHVDRYVDLDRRHDCNDHNFGHVEQHSNNGYAQNGKDWDDGVYFKRSKKKH